MTTAQPIAVLSNSQVDFLKLKKQYGIFSGDEFQPTLGRLLAAEHIVQGLLPARSVNIMVGDSGIGKSALAYQMGLAVASGTPFLGMATNKARKVLLVDFENSPGDAHWMMEQQRKHLRLERFPYTMQVWPILLNPLQDEVEDVMASFAPDLVIIDSLRSFSPRMESDIASAIEQIGRLRFLAAEKGTAFLLIHHLRKGGATGTLDDTAVMDWLTRAAGVRALINQTDVRIAVEGTADGLVMRGHFRTRGEVGPLHVRRVWDDAGEPSGYERVTAPASLDNADQQTALDSLPAAFSFKDARLAYGRQDPATNLFLSKLMRIGLITKSARGQFCKVEKV